MTRPKPGKARAFKLHFNSRRFHNLFFKGKRMSGTQPQGTNAGTFTAPVGDNAVEFFARVTAGTDDSTPPEITLLNSAQGTISIGTESSDVFGSYYPVKITGLAWNSTNEVQVAGDNVDDCYATFIIQPQNVETFTIDPSSVTFSNG